MIFFVQTALMIAGSRGNEQASVVLIMIRKIGLSSLVTYSDRTNTNFHVLSSPIQMAAISSSKNGHSEESIGIH